MLLFIPLKAISAMSTIFHSSALGRIPRSGEKVPFTPENLDHVLEKSV
jgi:hypothetical protein